MKNYGWWDWSSGASIPEARVVVCAPGLIASNIVSTTEPIAAQALAGLSAAISKGIVGVIPELSPVLAAMSDRPPPTGAIPAMFVRAQSDLARLPSLFQAKAERRALVIAPQEAISLDHAFGLKHGNIWRQCLCDEIDPSDRPCLVCDGRRSLGEKSGVDLVIVTGLDKPIHPDWVRSILDQCKTAGVPCVFLGWGAWAPALFWEGYQKGEARGKPFGTLYPSGNWEAGFAQYPSRKMGIEVIRVGAEHSGALLDGAEHHDLPDWINQ